jgi:hypothetical protein
MSSPSRKKKKQKTMGNSSSSTDLSDLEPLLVYLFQKERGQPRRVHGFLMTALERILGAPPAVQRELRHGSNWFQKEFDRHYTKIMLGSSWTTDEKRLACSLREYIQNACDSKANVIQSIVFTTEIVVNDKGKPEPFGKPSFGVAVADNGKGMFIDFLDKYFLTLNDSSKTQDTTQQGGFGIGRLLMMAYRQWYVITRNTIVFGHFSKYCLCCLNCCLSGTFTEWKRDASTGKYPRTCSLCSWNEKDPRVRGTVVITDGDFESNATMKQKQSRARRAVNWLFQHSIEKRTSPTLLYGEFFSAHGLASFSHASMFPIALEAEYLKANDPHHLGNVIDQNPNGEEDHTLKQYRKGVFSSKYYGSQRITGRVCIDLPTLTGKGTVVKIAPLLRWDEDNKMWFCDRERVLSRNNVPVLLYGNNTPFGLKMFDFSIQQMPLDLYSAANGFNGFVIAAEGDSVCLFDPNRCKLALWDYDDALTRKFAKGANNDLQTHATIPGRSIQSLLDYAEKDLFGDLFNKPVYDEEEGYETRSSSDLNDPRTTGTSAGTSSFQTSSPTYDTAEGRRIQVGTDGTVVSDSSARIPDVWKQTTLKKKSPEGASSSSSPAKPASVSTESFGTVPMDMDRAAFLPQTRCEEKQQGKYSSPSKTDDSLNATVCSTGGCNGEVIETKHGLCEHCRQNIVLFLGARMAVPVKEKNNLSFKEQPDTIILRPEWKAWLPGIVNGEWSPDQSDMIINVFLSCLLVAKITNSNMEQFGLSFLPDVAGTCQFRTISINVAYFFEHMQKKSIDVTNLYEMLYSVNKDDCDCGREHLERWRCLRQTIIHEFAHLRAPPGSGHDLNWASTMQSLGLMMSCFSDIRRSRSTSNTMSGPQYFVNVLRNMKQKFRKMLTRVGFVMPSKKRKSWRRRMVKKRDDGAGSSSTHTGEKPNLKRKRDGDAAVIPTPTIIDIVDLTSDSDN